MNPARESTATEQFGPYEVYERLGMGGMASVHRAKKRGPAGFERTVALKRMLSHLTEDRGFVESFVREAKVASLLQHPNIAQTYDFGRINGVFYIAMELVAGYDVRKLLRHAHRSNEPIPLPVVISILGELCEALDYAHSFVDENGQPMHIVHRDISPSNMLLAHTGHLKVIDFGIAKANSRQLHTESGLVKGKLGYMAPEAALGMPIGPVSDLFSMGVVAWELVTCMPLFSARTDFETMRKLREEPVVPPSQHNPGCPPMLDHLILAALEREPERRLQSARAFRATLDQIAAQFGIQTSARAVQEWVRLLVPPAEPGGGGESSRPRSTSGLQLPLPPGPPTVMQRPTSASRAQLRRSTEEIQLAADIWGEDATQASDSDLGDFSMAAGQDGAVVAVHSVPHLASVPSLASQAPPVYPSQPSQPAYPGHPSQPLPPIAVTPLGLSVPSLAASGGHVMPARLSSVATAQAHQGSQVLAAPPRTRTPLLVLAGLAVVAGVLGGVLYAKRSGDAAPAAAAAPAGARVVFETQPAGATIEVGGKVLAGVSPLETELAPGVYSIAIKREGYRTMTTTVTLREGDSMPITVALEPEAEPVAVVTPPPAAADPEPVPAPSADDASSVSEPDDDSTDRKPATSSRKSRNHKPDRPVASANVEADPAPDPKPDPGTPTTKVEPAPDPKPDKPAPKPDPSVVAPKLAPKPDPVVDSKPVRVPTVSPAAVSKLSGDIPTLRSTSGESGDVTTKLCIDEQGRVTSVKVIKAPADIADDLQRALMSWRYKPYVNRDAKVSPACFPVAMRVILR